MKIDGECFCGAIAFEAEIDPDNIQACHCTDCQTVSGSAFRVSARTNPDSFSLTRGAPTLYTKTAESGNKREQGFCPTCGTSIFSTSPGDGPKVYVLRLGTIRQRAELSPKRRTWCRSTPGWLDSLDTLPASETSPS